MAQARPSMQELIRQRRRAGFVGRGAERAAFRENFDLPPEDERHRFLFHVHGNAGVGKTFLVRELEQLAREKGALTAYVDETVGSVPEAMAAIGRQFAAQGHKFKDLERLLAAHRERRHEAEAAVAAPEPEPQAPSAGSTAVMRAGLVGLGMVPGVGAFAGALDAAQLAQGADRLRAGLSSRFRNQEDMQLVLSPERVLTPALLIELSDAAARVPWIVLVFDTYERTGPFLDGWLHEMMTTDRHGTLPATVVVITAGQYPFDTARWGGFADFMTDAPLGPFTESETRGLLADKGVVAEPVVEEVLRLTGGLPVLVSTLAEQRPTGPDDIGDLSSTAVERFLKWEQDPVRRAVALACALPRRLDVDVFRAAVECPDEDVDTLFAWLRDLAFVDDRGDRLRYHDLVREPMLRLQRRRSPRDWIERHERLAGVFGRWREEASSGLSAFAEWVDEPWRELRLEESYHLLCARPRTALGGALRDLVWVCGADEGAGRRWAGMLAEAGDATGDSTLREWGRLLREALADDATAMTKLADLVLSRPGLDPRGRAVAFTFRARELRYEGKYELSLADCDRAIALDPELTPAHHGRGLTCRSLGDFPAALAAFDRADELTPDREWIIAERAETCRLAGRFQEAVADFDRAVALDPTDPEYLTGRAVCRQELGLYDEALDDFDQALGLDGEYLWALVRRSRLHHARRDSEEAFADLDRAVHIAPDNPWVASERGEAYRLAGRFEEAVTEFDRAISHSPDYVSVLASRGWTQHELGRHDEALTDLSRAIELSPDYAWALVIRARVKDELDDQEGRFEDLRRAAEVDATNGWAAAEAGAAYNLAGRYDEAFAAFDRALELDPRYGWAHGQRARLCLAVGRSERALADMDRCAALDSESDWARLTAIDLLILCGRWDEVLPRLTDADRAGVTHTDLDLRRVEVYRHNGQGAEARRLAERLREAEPLYATFQLALTVARFEGLRAADSLWRELARLKHEDGGLGEIAHAQGTCFIGCGLADWAMADQGLTDFLALEPGWDESAYLAAVLTEILRSPDADRTRLEPILAAVTEACDAARARYTE
ncbi:tetratricopeptide repeat protein [Streptomyces chartreusis]|uniref:tetratricopeptide repeat protein n=1 Tax=Streptomyces chartreusis TaxID=1969 RepID=UPI0033D85935